ncbi:glycosyltransferase 2-like domain-containing protein [Pseudoscourfieldia marina]
MAALVRRLALLVLLLLATRLHPAAAELDDELEEAPDASSSASTLKRKLSPLEPVACPLVHAKRPRQIAPKFPGCKSSYVDEPQTVTLVLASAGGPPANLRASLTSAGVINQHVLILVDGAAEDGVTRTGFKGRAAWARAFTGNTHHLIFSSGRLGYARALNRLLSAVAFSAAQVIVLPLDTPERVSASEGNELGRWLAGARRALASAPPQVAALAACGASSTAFETKRRADRLPAVLAPLPGVPYIARARALLEAGGWRAAGCTSSSGSEDGGCEAASLADMGARLWAAGKEVRAYVGDEVGALKNSEKRWCDRPGARQASFSRNETACANAFHEASTRASQLISAAASKRGARRMPSTTEFLGELHAGCPAPADDKGICPPEPVPMLSLTLQYFRRGSYVGKLGDALRDSWTRLGGGTNVEVIVNNDSGDSHPRWSAQLARMPRALLVYSNNLHEIRAYNLMTRMSRAEVVAHLQDDDKPHGGWASNAVKLFGARRKLGLLGGYRGRFDGGSITELNIKMQAKNHIKYGPSCKNSIPTVEPLTKIPMMLIYKVNAAPLVVRRSVFLQLGGFQLGFSCKGESGIGFDFEYSVRNWKNGYEVALWNANFRKLGGTGGTRASKSKFDKRRRTEIRNNRIMFKMYPGFHHNKGNGMAMQANKGLVRRGRQRGSSFDPSNGFPNFSGNRQCTDPWHG